MLNQKEDFQIFIGVERMMDRLKISMASIALQQ